MKQDKKKKFDGSVKEQIVSILIGIVSIVVIFFGLNFFMMISALVQFNDTARIELEILKNHLTSSIKQEDVQFTNKDYRESLIQLALLMLENEELSDEALAQVCGHLSNDGMLIFDKEGRVLYSYGDVERDRDFLISLTKTSTAKVDNTYSYISIPLRDELYLAARILDFTEEDLKQLLVDDGLMEETVGFELPSIVSSLSSEVMVVMKESGELINAPKSMLGKNLNTYLNETNMWNENFCTMNIDGVVKVAYCTEYTDYLLLATKDMKAVMTKKWSTIPPLLGFGTLILLLVAYVQFIRTDIRLGRIKNVNYIKIKKNRYLNTEIFRRLSVVAIIASILIMVIVYCLQILTNLDQQEDVAVQRLEVAAAVMEEELELNQSAVEVLGSDILSIAEGIRVILNVKHNLLTQESLDMLVRIYEVSSIRVIDGLGQTLISSSNPIDFDINNTNQENDTSFWDVINHFASHHMEIVAGETEKIAHIGVPLGNSRGMLLVSYPYEIGITIIKTDEDFKDLRVFGEDEESWMLVIDPKSGVCVFDSSNWYTGQHISDFHVKEEFLRNGYSGTHMFANQECQLTARTMGDFVLLYASSTRWSVLNSYMLTALVMIISLLVMVLVLIPHIFVSAPGSDIPPFVQSNRVTRKQLHISISSRGNGEIHMEEGEKERRSLGTYWSKKDSGQKLRSIIKIILSLIAGYLLFIIVFGTGTEDSPLLEHIMERNWDKGLNIYAISYVTIALSAIWFVANVLQRVTTYITSTFGLRWKTTGILLGNIIRYTMLIVSIFFTLRNLGVETSTLVTSASILTLVIGFGSQTLVSDLISGILLIFEGTFRVGDIVTIDNWRGEVIEIGLRATKVKNEQGNIKIFQNSRISGAVNMTSDKSLAVCDIVMPQGETLEIFEKKLEGFFDYAKTTVPTLKYPLQYEGVITVSGNNATLRITGQCLEEEREQLQRDLYRAYKIWQEMLSAEKTEENST